MPGPAADLESQRRRWREFPREIEQPGPGQESVWDSPRPPRVEPVSLRLRVEHAAVSLAETLRGLRLRQQSFRA